MAYVPNSGSVVAFEGTVPWSVLGNIGGSVISVNQGSIATVIIGGSIAASFTPPANQSVSGTVGASVIGNVNTTVTSIATLLGVVPILSNNVTIPADGVNYGMQEALASGGSQNALTVGTFGFNYNGSNFDRVRGNSSIGTLVSTANSSVITTNQGSIATVIIGGSIAASFTPPANQSVSGAVQIAGISPSSILTLTRIDNQMTGSMMGIIGQVALHGQSPSHSGQYLDVVVDGGTQALLTSVVGLQGASVSGTVVATQLAGSIMATSATVTMSNSSVMLLNGGNTIGSVTALQGTNPYVMTGSVQGTMSVLGTVPVTQSTSPWIITGSVQGSFSPSGNQSVSGTVNLGAGAAVIGSVAVLQGTNPWIETFSNSSIIAIATGSVVNITQGSVATVIIGGSIAASFTPPANQSVSGTVGASVIGTVPVTQTTIPWTISSIYGNVSGSIAGTYTSSTVATTVTGLAVMFKPNVSSSIMTEISPTWPLPITGAVAASISGVVQISSVYGNISGSVVATQGTTPWTISSVYGNVSGSVVAFPGTNPWPVVNVGSIISLNVGSIIAIVQGSIAALQSGGYTNSIIGGASVFQYGTWKTSIASEYATGASSIISGLGNLTLGVRNDTLGSVLASIDGSYGPFTTGSWGDQVVSYAPQGAWITGIASAFTGVEQPVITSVTGKYINVTGVQIANGSANNVYVSFYGAGLGSVTGSIIGFSVAPANGGSNIYFPVPLRTAIGSPFSASISGVASVFLSAQGFYSKS